MAFNESDMNHRDEVHGQPLESCAQATAFLEPADALLDGAALTIELLVEAVPPVVGVLVAAPRNDDADRMAVKPGADARVAVALVARQALWPRPWRTEGLADAHPVQDFFELRALVDLPGRDVDREGESVTVSNRVEFAAESTARAAQCVVFGFFGAPFLPAPAAAREARTVEPSTHQRSQSMWPSASSRICKDSRIRSKILVRRQELE